MAGFLLLPFNNELKGVLYFFATPIGTPQEAALHAANYGALRGAVAAAAAAGGAPCDVLRAGPGEGGVHVMLQ